MNLDGAVDVKKKSSVGLHSATPLSFPPSLPHSLSLLQVSGFDRTAFSRGRATFPSPGCDSRSVLGDFLLFPHTLQEKEGASVCVSVTLSLSRSPALCVCVKRGGSRGAVWLLEGMWEACIVLCCGRSR